MGRETSRIGGSNGVSTLVGLSVMIGIRWNVGCMGITKQKHGLKERVAPLPPPEFWWQKGRTYYK